MSADKYWNISGGLFYDQNGREYSVSGRADSVWPTVCLTVDPDDDGQAVQVSMGTDYALKLGKALIETAVRAGLRSEQKAKQKAEAAE